MAINAFEKICLVRKIQDISPVQKLIILTICSHLGDNDFAFLSLTTLQKECCIASRHNVTDNLDILVEKKYIIKIPPSDGFKSNRYEIDFNFITSAVKELVPQRNQTSAAKELPQCRKGTRLVPQRNPKEIQSNLKKEKESARAENTHAEKPHTDFFLPNEENKILCDNLGLTLEDEVQKFLSRHKYQKSQPEFTIWLKGSSVYKKSNQFKNLSSRAQEIKSTVPFFDEVTEETREKEREYWKEKRKGNQVHIANIFELCGLRGKR